MNGPESCRSWPVGRQTRHSSLIDAMLSWCQSAQQCGCGVRLGDADVPLSCLWGSSTETLRMVGGAQEGAMRLAPRAANQHKYKHNDRIVVIANADT